MMKTLSGDRAKDFVDGLIYEKKQVHEGSL